MSPWPDSLCLVTPQRVDTLPHARYILPRTCFCLVRVCAVGSICHGDRVLWGPCAMGTVCCGDRVLWGPCAVGTMWLSFQFHPGKTMVWIMEKKQLVQCHEMNGGGWGPCKSGHQLSTLVPKHSQCLSLLAMAWLPSPPAIAWLPSPPAPAWLPAPAVGRLSLRELVPAQSYQRFWKIL